ncbi:MAG TPA: hypothetical protein VEH27_10050 [Methylomirabilota bacterium]|nr:hypothetical protein [Methylomirabilota bacterium]
MLVLGIGLTLLAGAVFGIVGMVQLATGRKGRIHPGVFILLGLGLQLWWVGLIALLVFKTVVLKQDT